VAGYLILKAIVKELKIGLRLTKFVTKRVDDVFGLAVQTRSLSW